MKIKYKQMVCFVRYFFVVGSLTMLSLTSCTKNSDIIGNDQQRDDKEITLTIPLSLSGIDTVEGATVTRSVGNRDAMQVVWGENPDAATRAEVDKSAAEMKIFKLYMLQFDGTTDAAKLLQCKSLDVSGLTGSSGSVNCTFKLPQATAQQTVYLVANVDLSAYENNTTLTKSAFLASVVKFSPVTSVPATGLPYMASNEFDPMTVASVSPFSLKALVAKLTYTLNVQAGMNNYLFGSLDVSLQQVASGTVYKEPAAYAAVYPSSGVSRNTSLPLETLAVNSTTTQLKGTVYLPENIAGQTTGITADFQRGGSKVKPGATYLCLEGYTNEVNVTKEVKYTIYLGDPANFNDFNVKRNTNYSLTATIKGISTADARMTYGKTYTNLNLAMNGSTAVTANCYIVTDDNGYYFDATKRGNNATERGSGIDYTKLPDLSTATEARRIWSENYISSNVKLANGRVLFDLYSSGSPGNLLIGIFASSAANAECLWSWHIWKMDRRPNYITCSKAPSPTSVSKIFKMMDRNLGACNNTQGDAGTIGLYYQWGRKDPFPGSSRAVHGAYANGGVAGSWSGSYVLPTANKNTSISNEAWAVKYPAVFLIGRDWISQQNEYLWGTPWVAAGSVDGYNGSQGTKSIYDPCPIGWRVPPQDFANGMSFVGTYRGGATINSGVENFWIPFAGMRSGDSGNLYGGDSNGYYWSSSPNASDSQNASTMFFNTNSANSRYSSYRACGYNIRCVSE